MINKDTILSVYTDKQTLLEYLTKIETALDKAVLTSSQLVYEGANNYHFKFVFEDGSSIETPSITLVQPISKVDFLANGNSVHFVFTLMDGETITTQTINLLKPVTAAAVRDGILYLTLSDGTEVSAGSIAASFGATTFNGDVLIHGNIHQTDGISVLGGDAEVGQNLVVDGTITQNTYDVDSQINIALQQSAINAGLSIFYSHVRVSNGKLNVVLAVTKSAGTGAISDYLGSGPITIPASIGAKLYPQQGRCLAAETKDTFNQDASGGFASYGAIGSILDCIVEKSNETTLAVSLGGAVLATTSSVNVWRFEFNFVLS